MLRITAIRCPRQSVTVAHALKSASVRPAIDPEALAQEFEAAAPPRLDDLF